MYLYLSGTTGENLAKAMGWTLEITPSAAPLGTGVQGLSAEPLPIQRCTTRHDVPGDVTGC